MSSSITKLLLITGMILIGFSTVSALPYRCRDMLYGDLDNPPCDTNTSYKYPWLSGDTYNTGLDYSGTYKSTGIVRSSDFPGYFWYYYTNTSTTSYSYFGHGWESQIDSKRITTYYTFIDSTLESATDDYAIYYHYMYNDTGLLNVDKAWLYQKISSGSNTVKEWWKFQCYGGYSGPITVIYALMQNAPTYYRMYHWCPGQYSPELWNSGARVCNTTLMNKRFVAAWNNSEVGSNNMLLVVSWDSNETRPDLFNDYGSGGGIYLIRPSWIGTCTGADENITLPPIYHRSYNITSYDPTDADSDGVPDQIQNIIDAYYPTQHMCGDDLINDTFYNETAMCSAGGLLYNADSQYSYDYYGDRTNSTTGKPICEIKGHVWFNGSADFSARTTKSTGSSPRGIARGDFDNDGKIDLVVTDSSSSTFSYFKGHGNGTFDDRTTTATATSPVGIISGDFNRDGNLDVVVAEYGNNNVSCFLGNGDGTFGTRLFNPSGGSSYGVEAGDFNNDGILDLVSTEFNGDTMSYYEGYGNGSFKPRVTKATGDGPWEIAVGDFNNDSALDVIVSYYTTNNLISYYKGFGNGSFDNKIDTVTGSSPFGISVGDFNSDGYLDVVTADYGNSNISYYEGYGNGSFKPRVTFKTGNNPYNVDVGDFNSDGYLDVVTADYLGSTFSYLEGNGNGTFDARTNKTAGTQPYGILALDFDDDGDLDVAVTDFGSATLSIYRNFALGGTNAPCCGDDTTSDMFYNGTIGNTTGFCVQGYALFGQAIDQNQTICEAFNYAWLSGTATGNYPNCCGDDSTSDMFYNGTIGSTDSFCYQGNPVFQKIDTNKTICEGYGYTWINQPVTNGTFEMDFTGYADGENILDLITWYYLIFPPSSTKWMHAYNEGGNMVGRYYDGATDSAFITFINFGSGGAIGEYMSFDIKTITPGSAASFIAAMDNTGNIAVVVAVLSTGYYAYDNASPVALQALGSGYDTLTIKTVNTTHWKVKIGETWYGPYVNYLGRVDGTIKSFMMGTDGTVASETFEVYVDNFQASWMRELYIQCCGDDGTSDDFYNQTFGAAGATYCCEGSSETNVDELGCSQTCSMGGTWFTGDISGNSTLQYCCGDDATSDTFYNSTHCCCSGAVKTYGEQCDTNGDGIDDAMCMAGLSNGFDVSLYYTSYVSYDEIFDKRIKIKLQDRSGKNRYDWPFEVDLNLERDSDPKNLRVADSAWQIKPTTVYTDNPGYSEFGVWLNNSFDETNFTMYNTDRNKFNITLMKGEGTLNAILFNVNGTVVINSTLSSNTTLMINATLGGTYVLNIKGTAMFRVNTTLPKTTLDSIKFRLGIQETNETELYFKLEPTARYLNVSIIPEGTLDINLTYVDDGTSLLSETKSSAYAPILNIVSYDNGRFIKLKLSGSVNNATIELSNATAVKGYIATEKRYWYDRDAPEVKVGFIDSLNYNTTKGLYAYYYNNLTSQVIPEFNTDLSTEENEALIKNTYISFSLINSTIISNNIELTDQANKWYTELQYYNGTTSSGYGLRDIVLVEDNNVRKVVRATSNTVPNITYYFTLWAYNKFLEINVGDEYELLSNYSIAFSPYIRMNNDEDDYWTYCGGEITIDNNAVHNINYDNLCPEEYVWLQKSDSSAVCGLVSKKESLRRSSDAMSLRGHPSYEWMKFNINKLRDGKNFLYIENSLDYTAISDFAQKVSGYYSSTKAIEYTIDLRTSQLSVSETFIK